MHWNTELYNLVKEICKQACAVFAALSRPEQSIIDAKCGFAFRTPIRLVLIANDSPLQAESAENDFLHDPRPNGSMLTPLPLATWAFGRGLFLDDFVNAPHVFRSCFGFLS
jgi:hypothetical protein